MKSNKVAKVVWPNGKNSTVKEGDDWIEIAKKEGIIINTGCLRGSCGSCEIEINGEVIRCCINKVHIKEEKYFKIELFEDPYW